MSTRKKILFIIIAIVLLGVILTIVKVVSHMIKTDSRKARLVKGPMPVTVIPAETKTIDYVVGASSETLEFEKASLTARVEQPIVLAKINVGEHVKKGQVVIRFEQKLMRAAVTQAQDNLTKAKTNLEYSKLYYQRLSNLYNQNLIPKIDLEKADEKVKDAESEYSTAAQKLEKAKQDLDFTVVKSPVAGVVLDRSANEGETPKLNEGIITLGIINDIFVQAKVPEEKISYVHLKQDAEILFDAFPNDIFKGKIFKIDPSTRSKTRTFLAYVKVANKNWKLTPGLTGFARLKYQKKALVVPSISVVNPVGENATVFTVDSNSIAHIKRVKIGISAEGFTEIVDGLKEGDEVVFGGLQFLKDGDKVNVMKGRP